MMEVSKEYARAVFMIAKENDSIDSYLDSLLKIRDIISETPDYIRFLQSPAISQRERLDAIDAAFSDTMPQYVVDFVKLLCTNGRIGLLGECIDEFTELVNILNEMENIVTEREELKARIQTLEETANAAREESEED